MKLLDLWKAKLKSAKVQQAIAKRQLNAATRAVFRLNLIILDLEKKIERNLAQFKSKTKHND